MPGTEKTYEELQAELALLRAREPQPEQSNVPATPIYAPPSAAPADQAPSADPYAITAWADSGYDFRVPSGQLCRLRKLDPAKLAVSGILDKITRLPGLAQDQIDRAEGAPPMKADEMPSADAVSALSEVLSMLVPLAVEKPTIYPVPAEGEERVTGRVYLDSVDFTDQVAIMERVTGGVRKMDAFRQ